MTLNLICITTAMVPVCILLFLSRELSPNCGECVGESCESNTKTIGCAGGSSKSGSTNRAFMQVWHKLHISCGVARV